MKVHIAVITTLVILLALVLIDDLRVRSDKHELAEEAEYQEYLKDIQKDDFNVEIAAKNKSLNEFETQAQMLNPYLLSNRDLKRLKEQGLGNPREDIKNSLIENQSYLLTDSLIDGRQRIFKDYILLLVGQRVLAYWEAGHSGGVFFASYEVDTGGKIKWQIIDKMD